ncbi:hypothetical protein BDN72DRAFT_954973 [Pluteus cervinus]|uniref:Uncharacterized protein n=1 Tax=Pluteus cervinus TaxID=181527 RepID=A0ACD3BCG1_9AGAR|nr:hypothetical protein BDN72DRAFT_954973 [Pluteus cervinus]
MDSPVSNPLVVPRLRLSRHPPSGLQDQEPPSQAGPSRHYPISRLSPVDDLSLLDSEDGEREGTATPIVSSKNAFHEPFSRVSDASSARSRLKEVLAQENSNSTPVPRSYDRETYSETESEAETRNGYSHTPNAAREGLRRLLNDGRRETDDPSQHTRRRRNSLDLSETEIKPQSDVRKARRSMSDEEAEYSHGSRQTGSSSGSKAANFHRLRQQLNGTQLKDEPTLDYLMSNDSYDTAAVLRDLANKITQPIATSTPPQSFRMSTESQFQSNLLEQDSEMRRAIADLDSYDAGNATTQRPLSFPPPRKPHLPTSRSNSPNQLPTDSHVKTDSWDRVHRHTEMSTQQSWEAKRSTSRAGSSHSSLDHKPVNNDTDKLHERERQWGKHRTPVRTSTPDLKHHHHSHGPPSRSASPALVPSLSRRNSAVSLQSETSMDSSFLSQSDFNDRVDEGEKEHNHELEVGWNKRRDKLGKQPSNASLGVSVERHRTYNQPTRPESSQAFLSPDQPVRGRRLSTSSSRAPSPARSRSRNGDDTDSDNEVLHEIEHERERNWNAPQPKWGHHDHPTSRSTSPIPPSPHLKPTHTPHGISRQDSLHTSDLRSSTSLRPSSPTPRLRKPVPTSSPSSRPSSYPSHPTSPSHSRSKSSITPGSQRPLSYPARPTSPLPPLKPVNGNKPLPSSAVKKATSTRWEESPERNLSKGSIHKSGPTSPSTNRIMRPSNRLDSPKSSQIPLKTPKKPANGSGRSDSASTSHSSSDHPHTTNGTLRAAGGSASVGNGSTSEKTPTRSIPSPEVERADGPLLLSPNPVYEGTPKGYRDVLPASPEVSITVLSPLPSPPIDSPPGSPLYLPSSVLQTPQKQSNSGNSLEFRTPPPPRDLPDLPDPPSASEEDDDEPMHSPLGRTPAHSLRMDLSNLKTPKPPGAWMTTPAPPARVAAPEEPTKQTTDADTRSFTSGLITPAASLSKGSHLPTKTPAPPGAWQATPALRKSILKVRFDTVDMSSSEASNAVDVEHHPSNFLANDEESVVTESQYDLHPILTNGGEPSRPANGTSTTPTNSPPAKRPLDEIKTPTSPPRKSSIRVVNAYGKEHPVQSSPKRNKLASGSGSLGKSSVRIVDAMGREMSPEPAQAEQDDEIQQMPLSHNEALVRVRQGLSDLVQDLDDLDRTIEDPVDKARYEQLQSASQQARTSRTQLQQTIEANDNEMRSQFAAMKNGHVKPTTQERTTLYLALKPWIVHFLIAALLYIFVYRWATYRAQQRFLTQFYDPFNPDLYLHVSRFDIQPTLSSFPWSSVPAILWNEGWSAFGAQLGRQFPSLFGGDRFWGLANNYTLPAGIPWPPT